MTHSIGKLGNHIYYTDLETGRRTKLAISADLLQVLQSDPQRGMEFKHVLQTLRFHEKEWKMYKKSGPKRIALQFGKIYGEWIDKLLTLNTPYNDTKHILQLIKGTEHYRFLTNENLPEMLNCQLKPYIDYSYEKSVDSFFSLLQLSIEKSELDLETARIMLHDDALVSVEDLFAGKSSDPDVVKLLQAMQQREDAIQGTPGRNNRGKGIDAEFTIRYLTHSDHFTYDLNKALNKHHPGYHRFYLGPDRKQMIEKRTID